MIESYTVYVRYYLSFNVLSISSFVTHFIIDETGWKKKHERNFGFKSAPGVTHTSFFTFS